MQAQYQSRFQCHLEGGEDMDIGGQGDLPAMIWAVHKVVYLAGTVWYDPVCWHEVFWID